jgi:alkylation response protein AidB-like acyl-CoA dehydrogenase
MQAIENKELVKGGEFLVKDIPATQVFIPEEFDEEQRMVAQSCLDLLDKEVLPILDKIDKAESPELMASLLDKSAELGLLATGVPEAYEGFGMNLNATMLVTDYLGGGHSFTVAFSAHTGIGTLPIQYYGNEAQKTKYLPKLATGELKACYCLTEPDSGSDANSGKTRATLSADGKHYVINGQKMWITNAGFADLFIVFAKIDDDKNLSAFIVEKDFGGITMNAPEHKMGIKGSDTRQVFFNDCHVPVENLLSERGNGFKIAVNILNIGRIKLGASNVGGARAALNHAIRYANERKQFGTAIANFGAIKHKLAEQAVRIYASESAVYRAGQNIDDCIEAFQAQGMEEAEAKLKSFEQFAIECALMKVHGSEVLDYCVDETVQVFGGMGYSADAPADRCYRDARINRIFEGTNEINRILAISTILKRGLKGELDLMSATKAVQAEVRQGIAPRQTDGTALSYEEAATKQLKKALLLMIGHTVQHVGEAIKDEQELLISLANMLVEVYAAESVVLRTQKLIQQRGTEACQYQEMMAKIYLQEAADQVYLNGKEVLSAIAQGEAYAQTLAALRQYTELNPINAKALRRQIADRLIAEGKYAF